MRRVARHRCFHAGLVGLALGLAAPAAAQDPADAAAIVPAAAPLRDVTLRNVSIRQADRTFILKNVEGLKLENVVIGGQRVDGRLDWLTRDSASSSRRPRP